MSETTIRIGITHGDPNGIGYEIISEIFSSPRMAELCRPILYGSSKVATHYRNLIERESAPSLHVISKAEEARSKRLNLIECVAGDYKVEPGVVSAAAGAAAAASLERAAADLKAGLIDAIVTAPICKESMQQSGFPFTGHTEFFADRFEGAPLMMMCSEVLKVGLVTIHIPVSEVSRSLSKEKIVKSLDLLKTSLIQDFSIRAPRIAVLALNPHAGDGGVIGSEEQEIIAPAIQEAIGAGVLAFGPFAADGFFSSAAYKRYDAVLAMYHDQGLAPFKALSGEGVNFTAGLDVVRTSPAHGVGFDIAGKGACDSQAMREAIYAAIDICRSRKSYARITADPLQKHKPQTPEHPHRSRSRDPHREADASQLLSEATQQHP